MPTRSAIDVAVSEILGPRPIRESDGPNRSPAIDEINREVGNPLGSPYCAAGVSHCFRAFHEYLPTAAGVGFPMSGSSQHILAWFRARGWAFEDPQRLLRCKGALGGWTDPDGAHGHIFFVRGRLTNTSGCVVALETLEYNTSPETQGAQGQGAYALRRDLHRLRETHPRFWFLDVGQIAGGQWWPAPNPAIAAGH